MKTIPSKWSLLSLLLGSIAMVTGLHAEITARVVPQTLVKGQSGNYIIEYEGRENINTPNSPRVDGLSFSPSPQTRLRQSIVNGAFSATRSFRWSFTATKTGTFTIPGQTISVRGERMKVPDVRVIVRDAEEGEPQEQPLFLRLNRPEEPWYVGQAVPVALEIWVRGDHRLADLGNLRKDGEAFQQEDFQSQPDRRQTRLNDLAYQVYSVKTVLTPLKAETSTILYSIDTAFEKPSRRDRTAP